MATCLVGKLGTLTLQAPWKGSHSSVFLFLGHAFIICVPILGSTCQQAESRSLEGKAGIRDSSEHQEDPSVTARSAPAWSIREPAKQSSK